MVTRSERSTGQSGCLGEVMLEVRAEGNAAGQGRFPKAGAETGGGGPGGAPGRRAALPGSACHAPKCFCLAQKSRSPCPGSDAGATVH